MLIYLACPHTSGNTAEIDARYIAVTHIQGRLLEMGYHVFSPITHSHPPQSMGFCSSWKGEDWLALDQHFIDLCDMLVVVKMPGWQTSEGVKYEIEQFDALQRLVVYIEPEQYLDDSCMAALKNTDTS